MPEVTVVADSAACAAGAHADEHLAAPGESLPAHRAPTALATLSKQLSKMSRRLEGFSPLHVVRRFRALIFIAAPS